MIRTLTNETFTSINVMDQGPYYNLIAYCTVEIHGHEFQMGSYRDVESSNHWNSSTFAFRVGFFFYYFFKKG